MASATAAATGSRNCGRRLRLTPQPALLGSTRFKVYLSEAPRPLGCSNASRSETKRPRSLRPAAFAFTSASELLRHDRLDYGDGVSGLRPDVVDARRGMAADLGSSVPGHGVLALRVPLVGDGTNQLAARVEDAHFDVTRLAHREVDLRDRVERVRIVLLQRDR